MPCTESISSTRSVAYAGVRVSDWSFCCAMPSKRCGDTKENLDADGRQQQTLRERCARHPGWTPARTHLPDVLIVALRHRQSPAADTCRTACSLLPSRRGDPQAPPATTMPYVCADSLHFWADLTETASYLLFTQERIQMIANSSSSRGATRAHGQKRRIFDCPPIQLGLLIGRQLYMEWAFPWHQQTLLEGCITAIPKGRGIQGPSHRFSYFGTSRSLSVESEADSAGAGSAIGQLGYRQVRQATSGKDEHRA